MYMHSVRLPVDGQVFVETASPERSMTLLSGNTDLAEVVTL